MIISKRVEELRNAIKELKRDDPELNVGFVPTMGALHEGHLSLVKHAWEYSDIVVVSIFVNPTQFNDPNDLEKYPRTFDKDAELLKNEGVDILFFPSESEIYPTNYEAPEIDLGGLDKVLEGKFRDGHFDGVAQVVHRLFEIVEPEVAFFGLKDFQQVSIIGQMVNSLDLDVTILAIPTVREESGLAKSSRNQLLSAEEKEDATIIFKTLEFGKKLSSELPDPQLVQEQMIEYFNQGNLKLEYLEIVDQSNLQPATAFNPGTYCCIAAHCGSVRLIDNMNFS